MQENAQQQIDLFREVEEFLCATKAAISALEDDPFLYRAISLSVDAICSIGPGKVITTGLGKAGHVAEKSASSFSSLGFPSCYLHPAQASHGDVGIVQPGDIMLAFSNSGKTREVIETIELARKLGVKTVIAVTHHGESPIHELADIVVGIEKIKEAGHLGLAPTTSVIVMLVLSDIIATMCACRMGLTTEEFGLRHHGGYLGRKCRGEEI